MVLVEADEDLYVFLLQLLPSLYRSNGLRKNNGPSSLIETALLLRMSWGRESIQVQ